MLLKSRSTNTGIPFPCWYIDIACIFKRQTVFRFAALPVLLFLLASCENPSKQSAGSKVEIKRYLFAGHCYNYLDTANRIDPRIPALGLFRFHEVILGGDIIYYGSRDSATLLAIDREFSLASEYTHWAIGNHDTAGGKDDLISGFTGRNTFYTFHRDGITFLILNTTLRDTNCAAKIAQYKMITSVCDTIKNSSHMILVGHDVIWGNAIPGIDLFTTGNGADPDFDFLCNHRAARFDDSVYFRLNSVRARGIGVICLAGDFGIFTPQFEYRDANGIVYLGAGMKRSTAWVKKSQYFGKDAVLVFRHKPESGELTWEFIRLNDFMGMWLL